MTAVTNGATCAPSATAQSPHSPEAGLHGKLQTARPMPTDSCHFISRSFTVLRGRCFDGDFYGEDTEAQTPKHCLGPGAGEHTDRPHPTPSTVQGPTSEAGAGQHEVSLEVDGAGRPGCAGCCPLLWAHQ